MALIPLKPTSAGRRSAVRVSTPGLHKGAPHAALTGSQDKTGGRNHYGNVSTALVVGLQLPHTDA